MTLVVQEVLQPQELDSAERTPVTPVHWDLQLTRLQDRNTHTHTYTHKHTQQTDVKHIDCAVQTQHWANSTDVGQGQKCVCVCVCVCVTRSSSNVNFWSHAWLLTDLQLVWPTTVLSSFNTALISSEETHTHTRYLLSTDVLIYWCIMVQPYLSVTLLKLNVIANLVS